MLATGIFKEVTKTGSFNLIKVNIDAVFIQLHHFSLLIPRSFRIDIHGEAVQQSDYKQKHPGFLPSFLQTLKIFKAVCVVVIAPNLSMNTAFMCHFGPAINICHFGPASVTEEP